MKEKRGELHHSKRIILGYDETNHGRFPEIVVGVASNRDGDLCEKDFGGKDRPRNRVFREMGSPWNPLKRLGEREYFFTLIDKEDYQKITRKDYIGIVTASLIQGEFPNLEEIYVAIDGPLGGPDRKRTQEIISSVCEIEIDNIHVKAGASLDTRCPIVHLADAIANYLFTRVPLAELTEDLHRKDLLRSLVGKII